MKIAIYHDLGPGGAFRTVAEFVRRAVGHECTVFTLDHGEHDLFAPVDPGMRRRDLSDECRQVRVAVEPPRRWLDSEGLLRLHLLRQVRRAERQVARMIDEGGFDVAYVHPCWLTQSPSLLRDLRTPTVYLMQEVRRATFEPGYRPSVRPTSPAGVPGWAAEELVQAVMRRLDIRAVSGATAIVNNSRYSQTQAVAAYGRPTTVVHLGVDTARFDLAPPGSATSGPARPYVMSVGGMEEPKGHHLVVEALGLLPPTDRPALRVVFERCDPTYLARVRSTARDLGVTLLESPGISDADLVDLYRGATASVGASRLEPLGLVPPESLACGTPVVVVAEGGYLETTVDGVNAVHVDRTPTALAEGLRRVLDGGVTLGSAELRGSILPYWSLDSSVSRQLDVLHAVARRPPVSVRPAPVPARAPLGHRLAYRALIRTAHVTAPDLVSGWWQRAWARGTTNFTGHDVVPIHGRPTMVNAGYAYPAFSRRWPTYNDPLVEVVHQTRVQRGRPITTVDVGAAVGDTVLLLMERCAGEVERYVCFEPDEEFQAYLQHNLGAEPGVEIHDDMLADVAGGQPELVRIHSGTASPQGEATRAARPMDDVLLPGGRVDVVKVDTDGFDGRVLAGARGLLERDHPSVIFEWHPLLVEATGEDWRRPFTVLADAGYRWFVWFTKEGDFSHVSDGFDESSVATLRRVCLDDGGPRPDWHFDVVALTDDDAPAPTVVAALAHARRGR